MPCPCVYVPSPAGYFATTFDTRRGEIRSPDFVGAGFKPAVAISARELALLPPSRLRRATSLEREAIELARLRRGLFDCEALSGIIFGSLKTTGTGFGSPDYKAQKPRPKNAAFLHAWPPMAGRAGSRKACRVPCSRSSNLYGSAYPFGSGKAENTTATRSYAMNAQAQAAPVYPLPPGIGKLTDFKVATLSKPGRYCDGAGLYLQITPKGTKSWIFRYIHHGKERCMGLGPLHTFSLDEARIAARCARIHVWYDRDPQQERCRNKGGWTQPIEEELNKTFNECLTEYFASHKTEWRSAKYARQWESALLKHISPHLGQLPVRQITTAHIHAALAPIWSTHASAPRLRGRIERILAWAMVCGYRKGDNPARWRGNLQELLSEPERIRTVQHHPSLPYQDISAFFEQLMTRQGCVVSRGKLAPNRPFKPNANPTSATGVAGYAVAPPTRRPRMSNGVASRTTRPER